MSKLSGRPGIRELVDVISSPPMIVLESFQDDLRSLSLRRRLSTLELQTIAYRVLQALSAAHQLNIVHTDIKPQNILYSGLEIEKGGRIQAMKRYLNGPATEIKNTSIRDQDQDAVNIPEFSVVLADWALASSPGKYVISPMSFRAPEVWLGRPWNQNADVWSFGIVMATLMLQFGREIFVSGDKGDNATASDLLAEMHLLFGPLPEHMIPAGVTPRFEEKVAAMRDKVVPWPKLAVQNDVPAEAAAFASRALRLDPAKRPTSSDLLNDPWLGVVARRSIAETRATT